MLLLSLALAVTISSGMSAAASSSNAPTEGVVIEVMPVDTHAESDHIVVQLVVSGGLSAERESSWGFATLLAVGFLDGPTEHLGVGESHAVAAAAQLTQKVEVRSDDIAITLAGPPQGLETALWLVAERLAARPMENVDWRARVRLFSDRRPTPGPIVLPAGGPLDHAYATLFGPLHGHTAHASRLHARSPTDSLLAIVADARTRVPVTVMVAGSSEALKEAPALIQRHFAGLAPRLGAAAARRGPEDILDWERRRPARTTASHDHDGRRFVTIAWDLRDVADRARIEPMEEDAIEQTVATILSSDGGLLIPALVGAHGLARDVIVSLRAEPPALLINATVRGRDSDEARRRILTEVAPLSRGGLSEALVSGAARRAADLLTDQWRHPETRLALIGQWRSRGLLTPDGVPADTYAGVIQGLGRVNGRAVRRWAEYALHPSRQVIIDLQPSRTSAEERVVVDADTLQSYVRLLVDLRCPLPGGAGDLVALLESKYGMTPEAYIALTRVVARQPRRIRELNHEAEQRCLEHRKLRALVPTSKLIALHRAVACTAGSIADDTKRERILSRLFRRFDLDPSVYRPLIAMADENPALSARLDRVDTRCKPSFGPGARR